MNSKSFIRSTAVGRSICVGAAGGWGVVVPGEDGKSIVKRTVAGIPGGAGGGALACRDGGAMVALYSPLLIANVATSVVFHVLLLLKGVLVAEVGNNLDSSEHGPSVEPDQSKLEDIANWAWNFLRRASAVTTDRTTSMLQHQNVYERHLVLLRYCIPLASFQHSHSANTLILPTFQFSHSSNLAT